MTRLLALIVLAALSLGAVPQARAQSGATLPPEFFLKKDKDKQKPPKQNGEESAPAKPRTTGTSSEATSATKGRFTRDGQGIITDKKTGLQWFVAEDQDVAWTRAQAWAQGLSVGGGGWRLPTMKELRDIYGSGVYVPSGKRYSLRIDPAFQLGGCCPWSSELKDAQSAQYLLFNGGGENAGNRETVSSGSRAMAVRSKR